jgi:hypothetical protein
MGLKQVGYGDVHKYLMTEHGDDFLDEENDEYDTGIRRGDGGVEAGENGDRAENEYGMDRYELDNELPQLVAYDDLEDGEVDYGFLAVGEED